MKGFLMQKAVKKTEKSPDYSGLIEIGEAKYDVAGWNKKSKKGADYISLALSVPREKNVAPAQAQEEIPF